MTRKQLLTAGFTAAMVRHRLQSGRLFRLQQVLSLAPATGRSSATGRRRSYTDCSNPGQDLAIPCTTIERTLIDLAAIRSPELERAVEEAFVKKLLGRSRMREALDKANGRTGTTELTRLLAGLLPQLPFARSELERRFLKLIAQENLPMPHVNRHRWPRDTRQPLRLRGAP